VTDLALILAVAGGLVAIYYVSDGRIRVGVAAVLGGLLFWRGNRTVKESLTVDPPPTIKPIGFNSDQATKDAQNTDERIDAISHDRPDDDGVRTGLELLEDRDAERRANRKPR